MRLVHTALLLALAVTQIPGPVAAEGLITPRRIVGVAFLGGSAVLAQKGFELKDEADDFYARYETASDQAEIERLYQRTTNRDVKSQVSWALAAAFGITGVRMLLTGSPEGPPQIERSGADRSMDASATAAWRDGLRWLPEVEPGRISLRLERSLR